MTLEDAININFVTPKCIVTGFAPDTPLNVQQTLISKGIRPNAILRDVVFRDGHIEVTVTFKDKTRSIQKVPFSFPQYVHIIE